MEDGYVLNNDLKMQIEQLSINNLKQLIELVLALWEDCEFEEEFDNYKNIIGSENEICYLYKDQENYIAFIHVSTRNDYVAGAVDLPVAYVEGIYVKPTYQKQGIAKKLMNVVEGWAKQKGYKQLASDTEITNTESIDFHKKIGFTEVERIVCLIKDL
ncbi:MULTISPECIES: aminoglycoside 6'-N-acetyltransferase [unclassified Arcicella]|uniref:aminoglycoside 6'-N-acetyltransferase n=2 Tax=Arcicella TaxID=217140 RepID=UPI002856DC6E|nr:MULTISPECIES: aminoglycoside 6'-N-acetyltransferase [unclassified Arcicella]MDR6562896.1 aminoglycoside 6'-N-acetyltransferase I [Arcicella sp. BE51]MDR6812979.1 aminoglycoside 6'-N-acetyltransferase I [Arcicella sp. BE140]MDR6824293.1 aminoglycoside 6'-N-acetyltransferase I [Arcicella sp. BE139]